MSANDYTPTTHYLRDIYCNHVQGVIGRGFNDDLMHKDAHAEFDRWVESVKDEFYKEGYKHGVLMERMTRGAGLDPNFMAN